MNNYIDYDSKSLFDVVAQFEIGLFDYLTRQMHLSYDIYAKSHTYDIYTYPIGAIKNCNLQIIKRKSFYDNTTNETVLKDTISFIRDNTDYPVDMIIDEWNTIIKLVNLMLENSNNNKYYSASFPVPPNICRSKR